MYKFLIPLFFLTTLTHLSFGQWKNENLKGKWIGTADFDLYPDLMFVDIDSLIKVKLFYHQEETGKSGDFTETNDSLKFIIDTPSMAASYKGEILNDSTIMGKFQVGYKEFDCNLIRLSPINIEDLGNLLGYFSFEDGRIIQIEPFSIDGSINPLRVLDFKNGKQRILYPTYKDSHQITFAAGPKMASSYPTDFTITLYKNENGEAERLQYDSYTEGTSLKEGKRLVELSNFKDISIKNEEVQIEGTLTYPNVESKNIPLVIFVPGAGEQFRGNMFDEYIRTLPYYGIATFVYDKRGCGVSTGNRKESDFYDLASDLKKIINKVKKQKNIDDTKIGLIGFDQAGYVMPLAIENNNDIQFVINISGAVSKFVDQERQALEKRLVADEFTPNDVSLTLQYQDELIKYLETGVKTEQLTEIHNRILVTPMIEYVTTLDETEYINWWKKYYDFDAKNSWEKVNIPVLTLYGEKDNLLDPQFNKNRIETFKNTSNFDTRILPNVNHLLIKGGKRGDVQLTEIEGFNPFLFKTINEWVGMQVGFIK